MKKYLIIGLLAVMGLGMMSCSGSSCDCKHEPVIPCQFNKKTIDLVAKTTDWSFDTGAKMYYCHFDLPELTSDIYNYAEVSVNREYNSGTPNAYQVALPETTYLSVDLDNEDGSTSPYHYQQHLDYAFGVGFIEIFCTISDLYYEGFTPDAMLFRLQLTY